MSSFPIRKYCKKCSIDYRVVSTANDCKSCKSKLIVEFDVVIPYKFSVSQYSEAKLGNIENILYTEYCLLYNFMKNRAVVGNNLGQFNNIEYFIKVEKRIAIKPYNFNEKVNNIQILESIYQEILDKEVMYLKCNINNDGIINFILTNNVDDIEKKDYEDINFECKEFLNCKINNNNMTILKLNKVVILKPNNIGKLLYKDKFGEITILRERVSGMSNIIENKTEEIKQLVERCKNNTEGIKQLMKICENNKKEILDLTNDNTEDIKYKPSNEGYILNIIKFIIFIILLLIVIN
jgi:hypothetical protein